MKKIFISLLMAGLLVACNEKKPTETTDAVVTDSPEKVAETNDSVTTLQEAAEAVNKIKEITAKSNFTPTGDMYKDAETIVAAQIKLAEKEVDGNVSQKETEEVTAMLLKLGEYYSKQGKQNEFQQILGQKMAEAIKKLKMEKLGS